MIPINPKDILWQDKKSNEQSYSEVFVQRNLKKPFTWIWVVITAIFIKVLGNLSAFDIVLGAIFIVGGLVHTYASTISYLKDGNTVSGYTKDALFQYQGNDANSFVSIPFEQLVNLKVKQVEGRKKTITFYNKNPNSYAAALLDAHCMVFKEVDIDEKDLQQLIDKI